MKYRPEIDGLRAIAVIPVILFHAGFQFFSGGYIGVDIFFVISGYLITTIILSEMSQGNFSLVKFYERRARRILPALFFIMIISIPPAGLWMLPHDMKDFSESLTTIALFSSNILFWTESGYWEPESELKPLLHTWSLGVEEQYYILFPLFLMLMWRYRKNWIPGSILFITTLSLGLSQWAANHIPSANFYLLPTRGWAITVGAIIAGLLMYRKNKLQIILNSRYLSDIFSAAGLLMIGYSVFFFDSNTPYPGLYTLTPVIGTGLFIIFTTDQSIPGKLIGSRILRSIGLISYSAYLWHQPMLAFARIKNPMFQNQYVYGIIVILTFIFGYASWRFIEQPFRNKEKFSRKSIFMFSAVGSLVFIAFGVTGHVTNGFLNVYPEEIQKKAIDIESKLLANTGLYRNCKYVVSPDKYCQTSNNPEIVVWGDSFAMHLVEGIIESKPDIKMIQITRSMCGPVINAATFIDPIHPIGVAENCLKFNANALDWLRNWQNKNHTIKYAVLSTPFAQYLTPKYSVLLRNGNIKHGEISILYSEFQKTLNELEKIGITPVIFSPPPLTNNHIGRCLAIKDWNRLNLDKCNFTDNDMTREIKEVYDYLDTLGKKYNVIRIDKILCKNSECMSHMGNTYIYRDTGHIAREGSRLLGKKFNFYKLITGN